MSILFIFPNLAILLCALILFVKNKIILRSARIVYIVVIAAFLLFKIMSWITYNIIINIEVDAMINYMSKWVVISVFIESLFLGMILLVGYKYVVVEAQPQKG